MPRFNRTARALGLGPLTEHEVEDRKGGGMEAEADLLARAVPPGAAGRGAGRTRVDAELARVRDADGGVAR